MIQFAHHSTNAVIVYRDDAAANTPFDLERLGDEIAELSAHLDAATYRLLVLLREFDARDGWHAGFRTCAHWLSWRTGIDLGAARERVRVARALDVLPLLGDGMRTGVLSYSKARALTRIATPDNEAELVELAKHGTAAHIERVVRTWRCLDRLEEAEQERQRHERRGLSLNIDDDGSYVLRGRLDPETGALLERAIEMATEALYSGAAARTHTLSERPNPAQQRADAIGLIAALALRGAPARGQAGIGEPTISQPISGTRAERFQVVMHVDLAALKSDPALHQSDPAARNTLVGSGLSELDNNVRVSAETSRRLACDATRVTMTVEADGVVAEAGRRTRTVPPALRRVLDRRDGGCRFPGCGLRHCDAHHVKHWADGGPTTRDNLILLCAFHHRLMHEEGYTVTATKANGSVAFGFYTPGGSLIPDAPTPGAVRDDVLSTLRRAHQDAGLQIHADTQPLWGGDVLDMNLALQSLRRRQLTPG